MKFFIVFAAFIAVALCAPHDNYIVSVRQDTSGKYKVEYNIGDISRLEERSQDGAVNGEYAYVDGDGQLQKIVYTSGVQGFQVSGTNLPVAPLPVQDTAEVLHARNEHLTTYEDVKSQLPVEYVPEHEY